MFYVQCEHFAEEIFKMRTTIKTFTYYGYDIYKIRYILGLFFELRVTLPRQYGLDISGETLQQLLMRNN